MPRTTDRETLRQLNLYEVLQISAKASPEVVQAAYRVLARVYHPDVNPSPNAARMMRQLNAAYTVLSDPQRRSRYDAQRAHSWRSRPTAPTAAATTTNAAPTPAPTPTPTPTPSPTNRPTSSATSMPGRPGVRRAVILPVEPVRTTWRVGRLIGLLLVLLLMMGALGFAFWLVVGVLEDEPLGPMHAATLYVGPHLTFLS